MLLSGSCSCNMLLITSVVIVQWIEFVSRTASQPRPRRLRCRHLGNAGCASTEPRGLCTTSVSWTTVITVATGTKNSTSGSRPTSRTACCGSMETAQTTFTSASVYVAIAVYTLSSCTHFGLLCPAPGEAFWDSAIRPSVCPMCSCLGYRHAGCLQLSHRRPPAMCGLRTRPRTVVDPPRFLDP